ncbi:MAG: alpha/beta fold hydrolase, partial [Anaerolineales bacterium]|nr:alpha/beta fold hydrolase [Anaerolineales bacterium]
MILMHGAGGNRLHWPPRLRRLSGVRTYALDLPAHGASGGRPESTISGYTERVMDWMRALELERAVVVGHSMGGAIALTMALRIPRVVAGAVLVGTSAQFEVGPKILHLSAKRATFPEAVERVVSAAFSRSAQGGLVEQARQRMLETEPDVFHADFRACAGF